MLAHPLPHLSVHHAHIVQEVQKESLEFTLKLAPSRLILLGCFARFFFAPLLFGEQLLFSEFPLPDLEVALIKLIDFVLKFDDAFFVDSIPGLQLILELMVVLSEFEAELFVVV